MATKKYALKRDKETYADGTSNAEHIKDIVCEIEILYGNIQDNNDICMQLYKIRQKQGADEDIVDALQIACENSIAIEQDAADVMKVVDKVKENISKFDKSNEEDVGNLLKQMRNLEKKSQKILQANLFKNN